MLTPHPGDDIVLRYSGLMGHEYTITRWHDGQRVKAGEADSQATAFAMAANITPDQEPAVYRKLPGKRWKRIV